MDLPRLRLIRQGAVMSQEELAERSGVARDTSSKLETVRKLAAGLDVQPQLLMGAVEYLDERPTLEPEENSQEKPERDRRIGF